MKYRTYKTTLGHKVRVRMSDEEVAARWLYGAALVIVPFVSSAVMMFIWLKAV